MDPSIGGFEDRKMDPSIGGIEDHKMDPSFLEKQERDVPTRRVRK